MGRAWLVAGMAHAALFVALGLATAWKTQPQTMLAQAELWSAVPRAAAPKLQEPTPPPPIDKPEPKAEPEPVRQPKPAPAAEPDMRLRDAQIALEKKKLEDQKMKEAAELQRKALEKKKKEAEEKAAKDKAEKDKAAKDKAAKEKAEKDKAAEAKRAQAKKEADQKKAAEKATEDLANEQARHQENLQRIQGMLGASGGPNATGTALQSSGPSASYAGRLVGRIRPNITYPGDVVGNARAEVEVRVAPDGTIISRRIVQSSGIKAWDDAVLRAIDKTEIFPRDTDGRVPPVIVLGFRPLD
jgi:colicin import membrane protein